MADLAFADDTQGEKQTRINDKSSSNNFESVDVKVEHDYLQLIVMSASMMCRK